MPRNAPIFKLSYLEEEVTENEMSTSIIFHVTVSLLFALMSLVLLILSSFVFMTSTFPLLQ